MDSQLSRVKITWSSLALSGMVQLTTRRGTPGLHIIVDRHATIGKVLVPPVVHILVEAHFGTFGRGAANRPAF